MEGGRTMADTIAIIGTSGRIARGEERAIYLRRFSAGDRSTRIVLADLIAVLSDSGVGADDLANVEIILAEALNNVSEHAYPQGAGPVELSVTLGPGGLKCVIGDHGQPMPDGHAPKGGEPRIEPPDHLPEGGFGWHIIRCLTTDLRYSRLDGQNFLSMLVPWSDLD